MKSRDELERENQALRDRISKLSAASLRISASLDVNIVLREIVASARTLTGARRGIIVATDESGQVQEYVLSGPTPDEQQRLERWADGPRFFDHLQNLSGVLRLNDLSGYVHSLGYSAFPVPSRAFQCTPLRHRDVHVGNFSLAGKEGGQEFTNEDEEVLVMFAAQAATAIANARTYRDEQRARADLEALVDTSPVGVVVFDVNTGTPLLFNQEAKRLVEGLRTPDRSPDQLLEDLMLRRADGREIALKEFPLENALSVVETVRAEEIVLSVPDGRSVTTLVNSTPILSGDGGIESVVVTMQDLAPLQELERLRAEFLGLVSHELRTPLTSIKGSATNARRTSPAPDPAVVQQFLRIIEEQADRMDRLLDDLLDAGRIETGALSVAPEPTEVSRLVDQARNTFLSGGGRHPVRIDLPPDLPRVLADGRRIVQVLNNLLSNAAKHSPESSPIRVAAIRDGVHVAISVSDEGRGVSPDLLPQLSGSTRVSPAAAGSEDPAWAWPSARGWWRPTGGASGPRAAGWAWARVSPSRFRWPTRPQPASHGTPPARLGKEGGERAFWWWTTIRRRSDMSGTLSRRPDTRRFSPATRARCPASSGRTIPG